MYHTEQEFLQNYDITKFDRPSLTTDIVLFALDKFQQSIKSIGINGLQVLLIKRNTFPFKDKWALPGGFCKPSETMIETAKRELYEETNVQDTALRLIGTYSSKDRDPRGWIISNAFMGIIDKETCNLRADTDAWEAGWFRIQDYQATTSETRTPTKITQTITHSFYLSNKEDFEFKEWIRCSVIETRNIYDTYCEITFADNNSELAFDHAQIICETYLHLKHTLKHDIRMLFNFFQDTFTIGELQKAYEIISGTPVQNFRRTIQPYVTETTTMAAKAGYRPAKLYARNLSTFIEDAYM